MTDFMKQCLWNKKYVHKSAHMRKFFFVSKSLINKKLFLQTFGVLHVICLSQNIMDTASLIGFVMLQNAKQRMLQFYSDFMDS